MHYAAYFMLHGLCTGPVLRGLQWNLTKSIQKRRLSRDPICIRFDDLTLLNLTNWRNDKSKRPIMIHKREKNLSNSWKESSHIT